MEPLKIEYLPVGALRPYERNARKHREEDIQGIVNSIQQFGFDDPIGIWGPDNLIAAEQNGRRAFCMEYDPKFVDVIIDRWEKFTGRKAVLLNGERAEPSPR